jgi:Glycosyltransferase family 87
VGGSTQQFGKRGWLAVAVLMLIYTWFWVVTSHRVYGAPFSGFAHEFVTGCGDFEHFYRGAKAMREGADPYSAGVRGYIYPPLIAFLFMPLTSVSVQTAAFITLALNMALALMCTVIACKEAVRRFSLDRPLSELLAVVALTTVLAAPRLRSELQMWQTNVPMLAATLLALRWLDRRPQWAGLMLGLAVNIKYLPLIYLPYLLLRRRFTAAAWFVLGIVLFAVLPAVYTGWTANFQHWATASSGIAQLLGIKVQTAQAANIDALTVGHSVSITSGMARIVAADAAPSLKWLMTAAAAAVAFAVLAAVYRRFGVPVLRWPRASVQKNEQTASPFRAVVALEWAALMALALAFSPQTNPRHLVLLLTAFALLSVLFYLPDAGSSPKRWPASRWLALAALAVMMAGLSLPPGTPQFATQLAWWRTVGGPGWSLVAMLPLLFAAGFTQLRNR